MNPYAQRPGNIETSPDNLRNVNSALSSCEGILYELAATGEYLRLIRRTAEYLVGGKVPETPTTSGPITPATTGLPEIKRVAVLLYQDVREIADILKGTTPDLPDDG